MTKQGTVSTVAQLRAGGFYFYFGRSYFRYAG